MQIPRACAWGKLSLPRAHVYLSAHVVVVGTKIARFLDLGICGCCKHNESVDICEKLVSVHLEWLNMAHKRVD